VQRGDRITANTVRKVSKETSSGSVSSEKRHLRLTIAVTAVDYDGEANIIRFSGKNRTESPYIKLNQHHTIEVGLNNKIQLSKGRWDSIALDILNEATNVSANAELAVVLIDSGLANLYLLTRVLAKDMAKVSVNIPKKRSGSSGYDKALNKFYDQVRSAGTLIRNGS
ncbi:hypothetical protein FOZ63_006878, partial [Perkinsus olseni]